MTGSVNDFGGVRLGSADANGEVTDHAGVHIGRVTERGEVVDFAGVRIGRVAGGTEDRDRPATETAAHS